MSSHHWFACCLVEGAGGSEIDAIACALLDLHTKETMTNGLLTWTAGLRASDNRALPWLYAGKGSHIFLVQHPAWLDSLRTSVLDLTAYCKHACPRSDCSRDFSIRSKLWQKPA